MVEKRLLSFVLVLVFIFSLNLFGCTNDKPSNDPDTTPDNQGENTQAPPNSNEPGQEELEEVTLEYWIMGAGKQKDSEKVWAQFNEEIAEFLPNTKVNFTVVYQEEYQTEWAKAMASQEKIDIAWTGWMHDLAAEANKGALMPIDDLVDEYGQDIVAFFTEPVLDAHRQPDGHLYQIPVWQGMGGRSAIRLPKELADLAGENYIQELQDLCYDTYDTPTVESKSKVYDKIEEYLKALKDNGKIGKGYPPGGIDHWYDNLATYGITTFGYVEYNDDTFTVSSRFESDLAQMQYQYAADWYKKDIFALT